MSEVAICAGCGTPTTSWCEGTGDFRCWDCMPPNGDGTIAAERFGERFGIRPVDLSRVRPVEFAWKPWLVRGRLNLMVGEEKVGKSTFAAYIAAKLTRGELAGIFETRPVDVLFVGCDEDDWHTATVPRLIAADADFEHVREFFPLNPADVFDAERDAADLGWLLDGVGLVVFEHLMDVLPKMSNYNDPAALRRATRPLRKVLADRDVGGLATLHVNKAQASSFRQRAQGSMQFGALARSSFLVDRHPQDPDPERRVAVLGPANYVRDDEPLGLSFRIESATFSYNGAPFDVGRVADAAPDDVSMDDVLGAGSERDRKRDERRATVLAALSTEPQSEVALARATGIPRTSVQRILDRLDADDGLAVQGEHGWTRVPTAHPPKGSEHWAPPNEAPNTGADDTADDTAETGVPTAHAPKGSGHRAPPRRRRRLAADLDLDTLEDRLRRFGEAER